MRLEVSHVTVSYGDAVAVRDVSITVPSGCVVALLGPNGAGKTTLLSAVSGLLKHHSGIVTLDGHDVSFLPPERRARLGLCHVTEGRSVFPGLTVADNLRMFSMVSDSDEGLDTALDAFPRLRERRNQLTGTLSGGEQQMLALARAYVQKASLVLLDEVSMGLAPIVVDEIFTALRTLADAGHSLLIVEQYVDKALALADLVYIMVRGRIVFCGEPSELAGSDIAAHYLGVHDETPVALQTLQTGG